MKIHDENIPEKEFSKFLSKMPQVSIELFVEHKKEVLLAKRKNPPAKGEWFWPGGRLYKGEKFKQAVKRISKKELNSKVQIQNLLGVYNHFWSKGKHKNTSTHTVNIVYHVKLKSSREEIELDDQHSEYIFTSKIEPEFHKYVKKYLKDSNLDF